MSKSKHTDLIQHLAGVLDARLQPNEPLWVALSGGRDSVVMLHALSRIYPGRLSAIHVHHGLSPNADQWVGFCQRFCSALGVSLNVCRVSLDQPGIGVEGAARHARYRAFAELGMVSLCLAHHREDQAETVLFNLFRGAGVQGLAGMREERCHGGLKIFRPLLGLARASIERYAAEHSLDWIEDESNRDTRFSRNFLRQDILPRVQARFPSVTQALARAATNMAEAADLLDALAQLDLQGALGVQGGISLQRFRQLDQARQKNLLRHAFRGAGLSMPDASALQEGLQQLAAIGPDNHFVFALDGADLRCWQGEIHLVKSCLAPCDERISWQGNGELSWAGGVLKAELLEGAGIAVSMLSGKPFTVSVRRGGESMSLGKNRPSRPVKKLLQEAHIPPWLRISLPMLFVEDTLVWVHGLGVAADWQAAEGETGLWPKWEF